MCGIKGVYACRDQVVAIVPDEVKRTRDAMAARGPDGGGLWIAEDRMLALGHRRHAIIDLTNAGAQPMHSADGRYTVTFNGEIYNYLHLRTELGSGGVTFRSHSDTEILLHLYHRDGPAIVEKLRGMFAFALWEKLTRTLFLARVRDENGHSRPEVSRDHARARHSPWCHIAPAYRGMHKLLGAWFNWPANEAGIPQYGNTPAGAYQLAKGAFMPWELPAALDPEILRQGMRALAAEDDARQDNIDNLNSFQQVAYLESVRYMRNQLRRDSDWVSMAHSLEIGVPLVDSALIEAIIGLAAKGRIGEGKAMLPQSLAKPLPASVLSRPKTGFTVPTRRWLRQRTDLAAWKRVPLLKQPRIQDNRRWAYTLLHRLPETNDLLK